MKPINEVKNVSNTVVELSNIICKEIIAQAKTTNIYDSTVTYRPFTEGCFKINATKFFRHIDELTINYVMYISKEENILQMILNQSQYDNSADYENKSITIVSGFVLNNVEEHFNAKVMHEVNHLYEYDNGMQKRVNLYNKALEMITDKINKDRAYVGRNMYYSFKHEQDAFVHQFYGYLKQNKPKHPFNDLIWKSEYKNVYNVYGYLCNNYYKETIQAAIKELGFSPNAFMNMIEHRLDRLYGKLYNAFRRYYSECEDYRNIEEKANKALHRFSYHLLMEEEVGRKLQYKMENIFDI